MRAHGQYSYYNQIQKNSQDRMKRVTSQKKESVDMSQTKVQRIQRMLDSHNKQSSHQKDRSVIANLDSRFKQLH